MDTVGRLLNTHFSGGSKPPTFGGSAFWVEGVKDLDTHQLAQTAAKHGILFEPGEVFFHSTHPRPKNYFRLGFSFILTDNIQKGFEKLIEIMD